MRPRTVPIGHRLAAAAYELHARVERSMGHVLQELDLTVPLADVIWRLDPAVGPVSRRELAERVGCDPSNVTFLVKRLQRRQLVSRRTAGHDRRITVLELTTAGVSVRNRLIMAIAESAIWDGLTPDERLQMLGLLARCVGG